MEIIVYHDRYYSEDSLEEFLDVLFYRGMDYFASDLLDKGLTPKDLSEAIKRSMLAGKTAGLELRRHFIPVYTQFEGALVKDCKLSKLGYALLLMNANVANPVVANWQVQVLERFVAGRESTFVFEGHEGASEVGSK